MESRSPMLPPRIAAIHDLSCFGRCALTVILPTLSAMGYQAVPLPTALLSTHTGGFDGLHFRDLTPDMEQTTAHFDRLDLSFRAIYTGFLGSAEQIHTVNNFLDLFGSKPDLSGKRPLILVDPVMGDDGALYSTYTPALVDGIRKLTDRAHLITPNFTEACLLAGLPYTDTRTLSEMALEDLLSSVFQKLKRPGQDIVITGVRTAKQTIKTYCLCDKGSILSTEIPCCRKDYPGTGDLFASVLLGLLLRGNTLPDACRETSAFVHRVLSFSAQFETPVRDGLAFEPFLKEL